MADHIEVFAAVEVSCFVRPWSALSIASHLTLADSISWLYDSQGQPLFSQNPDARASASQNELDGAVGALLGRWLRGEQALELLRIAVLPRHRRRGLALVMLRDFCQRLPPLLFPKPDQALLEVQEENRPAVTLYQRLGFECYRRRRDYYGRGKDGLEMKLALS
ncbi:MAG: GNAT family N-acetyltransferase [Leptospirales bacterium]|nr:GNAT family N-acetyltransferase [Leptospirales bacterium]